MPIRTLILILAVLITFGVAGCASSSGTKVQGTADDGSVVTTYDDPKHGLRLTYPGDWDEVGGIMKPRGAILLLSPPGGDAVMPPVVGVVVPDSKEEVSADDLDAMRDRTIEKARREIGDFQLLDSSETTVGSAPARRVIYTGKKLGQPIQVMYVLTTHARRAYAFTYMSSPTNFDAHRPAVDRFVQSVTWMN